MANFALSCPKLVRFVYVSTAYASAFLRQASDGSLVGADAVIYEEIHPIHADEGTLDKELADLEVSGSTMEFGLVRHLSANTYAKHLTERLLLRSFAQSGVPNKLLIFRPSVIGPAEEFPSPFFEIPGSCPVTTFLALALALPPQKTRCSSHLSDPTKSSYDEIPVDIAVNRLIVHTAHETSGCVHAVSGDDGRQVSQVRWDEVTRLRPFWWGRPKLVWCKKSRRSDKVLELANLYTTHGTSFCFDDTKADQAWKDMSDSEQADWPLWADSDLSDLKYIHGRRKSVEFLAGKIISEQYGLPASWSRFICSRL